MFRTISILTPVAIAALLVFSATASLAEETNKELTDAEIKRILIRGSISRYSGSCPCPYNVDRAGRKCGGRSAYSRPGGASPLCYDRDVTDQMVQQYRLRTK